MKKKFDFNGLKFNIWFYFVIFALLIISVLWIFQIMFLNSSYTSMKIREVERIGNSLAATYEKPNFADEVQRVAFNSSVMVLVFEVEGENVRYLAASNGFGGLEEDLKIDEESMQKFLTHMEQSDGGRAHYVQKYSLDRRMLIYGVSLHNRPDVYMYINAPLTPVDITTNILRDQLVIVTIIAFGLAFILSFFISSQLSKPIVKMSEAAKKLAKGDYGVRFEGNGYTEVDKLSDTLNYATEELENTDKLRKELIANVSHDLRTPLTLIKSYAEMIRDLSGENKVRREEHLNIIINETDRLSKLVNDLLALSKMQAGSDELMLEKFNLSELVDRVVQHFQILVENQGYTISTLIARGIWVRADENKIEQVIYNLVSNAVNYTGADKFIEIRRSKENGIARFEVEDTGKGLTKKEKEQIWDRYYRSAEAHKRSKIGTGLGLNIVKKILEAHKAEYGVDSVVNKGSVFYFELPMASENEPSEVAPQGESALPPTTAER